MTHDTSQTYWDKCVLGVDPGSYYCGFAVVTNDFKLAFSDVVTAKGVPTKRRLISFYLYAVKMVKTYHPTHVCVEKTIRQASQEVEFMNWLIGSMMILESLTVPKGISPTVILYNHKDIAYAFNNARKPSKRKVRRKVEHILDCRFLTEISPDGLTGGHDSDAASVGIFHLSEGYRRHATRERDI